MGGLRVTRVLLVGALGLGAFYVFVLLVLWRYQERVVFQPPRGVAPSDVPASQVRYRSSDGVELFAYVVGACQPGTDVLLAFHGNADLSRWFVPWAAVVAKQTGACVVLPEYRGYDGLGGTPTYSGAERDAVAALDYVREHMHVAPEHLLYFGHSLGSAIAAELAAAAPPRALILQSPFSSARDMARRMFVPGLAVFWRAISRVHFDTVERVRASDVPVWVSHGDTDFVIPVRMGRAVFSAAKVKGELLIVPRAGHNDVPQVGGGDYWNWLRRAMASGQTPTRAAREGTRSEP